MKLKMYAEGASLVTMASGIKGVSVQNLNEELGHTRYNELECIWELRLEGAANDRTR